MTQAHHILPDTRLSSSDHGGFSAAGSYHAVSLSGGKDNEKRYKMKSHLQKD